MNATETEGRQNMIDFQDEEELSDGPTRALRIEGVPLVHVLALKAKAAAVDSTMARMIREMIAAAVAE